MIDIFLALILFCVTAAIARDISWKHASAFVVAIAVVASLT